MALKRLDTGKTPLVVIADVSGPLTYRYDADPARGRVARAAVDDMIQSGMGRKDSSPPASSAHQEPGSRYIDFLIPGLIGLNTMGGGLWGIGFLLVNFRIAKLLKCFMATPMPRRDFLLALLGARLTFLIPDLAVLLLLGTLVFGMPIRGSLFLVVVIDVVGALAFAGIGLLIASRRPDHRDRQRPDEPGDAADVALLGRLLLLRAVPRRDAAVHPGPPARPSPQGAPAVILEGMGWLDVAPAMAILAAWAVVTFLVALRIFRWT